MEGVAQNEERRPASGGDRKSRERSEMSARFSIWRKGRRRQSRKKEKLPGPVCGYGSVFSGSRFWELWRPVVWQKGLNTLFGGAGIISRHMRRILIINAAGDAIYLSSAVPGLYLREEVLVLKPMLGLAIGAIMCAIRRFRREVFRFYGSALHAV